MTESNVDNNDVICHCTCTTRGQMIALIHSGSDTLAKISYMTGAAAGCGACETWIEDLLLEMQQK